MKFDNLEETIVSFIDKLENDTDNQSQLISDFQDYYLQGERALLLPDLLKRLFHGYLRNKGLLDHFKECHNDLMSLKSRGLISLFAKLMDNNLSHQIEEITKIWREQPAQYIKDCQFEKLIAGQ